jgi:hypothetical protein
VRVKLKERSEIKLTGFKIRNIGRADHPNYVELLDPVQGVAVSLDLRRCKDLLVVPSNSITEEMYTMFEPCFEVLK